MIALEDLKAGLSLVGIEPTLVVTLVALDPIGEDAVQAVYKTSEGTLKERLLTRADEAGISVATEWRPWAFDGNGCFQPGQASATYSDALTRLADRLHYLNSSGDKCRTRRGTGSIRGQTSVGRWRTARSGSTTGTRCAPRWPRCSRR